MVFFRRVPVTSVQVNMIDEAKNFPRFVDHQLSRVRCPSRIAVSRLLTVPFRLSPLCTGKIFFRLQAAPSFEKLKERKHLLSHR